jgi:hypothetical protein
MNRTTGALLAGVLLLAACEKTETPAPSESASVAPPAMSAAALPSALPSAAPSAEVVEAEAGIEDAAVGTESDAGATDTGKKAAPDRVKLLSPGKAPLTLLRYVFKPKHVDRLDMTTTSQLSMKARGQTLPSASSPGVKVLASLAIVTVDADGTAHRKLKFDKVSLLPGPGVDAATRAKAEESLKGLEAITGKDRVDSRGFVHSVKLDASKVENPQLKAAVSSMEQTFDQMGAPFPAEEVGVGARWQVKTRLDQMGIRLSQVATYELLSFSGHGGKIKVKLTQSAPGGRMQLPGLPPGAKAKLQGMTGSGSGELAFDLERGVPDGQIDTESEVTVQVDLGGQTQEMQTHLKAKVRFKPL